MTQLLATAGTILVEASPLDTLWGIGYDAKHPRAANKKTWRGTNWLGYILTELREVFLSAEVFDEFASNF